MKKRNRPNAHARIDREPDFETESARFWRGRPGEKEMLAAENDTALEVSYKGMRMKLVGFNVFRKARTEEVLAIKEKHEEGILIYHASHDSVETQEFIKTIAKLRGLQLVKVSDALKNAYEQRHVFKTLGREQNQSADRKNT